MKYKLGIDMCYFTNVHGGGKDAVIHNLLKGFEKIGVSNEIVCFCYRPFYKNLIENYPDIKVIVIPKIRSFGYFQDFHMFCRGIIEDVIARTIGIGCLLFPNKPSINKKLRTPTIEIPHDIEVFSNKKLPGINFDEKYYDDLTSRIIQDFTNRDYIIAISEFDKWQMETYMPWASEKIHRIYNPIIFNDNVKVNVLDKCKYITALNIQHKHKNVVTLIKAFSMIADKCNYDLLLVGKLPDENDYIYAEINKSKFKNRIKLTGFVTDEDLKDIISNTRVFVNASFFEGFGMTPIEMMARGVPTIVADNTAQKETTMGLCEYYSPTDDATALSKVILNVLDNPNSIKKRENIAKKLKDKYSYEIIAKEYWNFVERVIER